MSLLNAVKPILNNNEQTNQQNNMADNFGVPGQVNFQNSNMNQMQNGQQINGHFDNPTAMYQQQMIDAKNNHMNQPYNNEMNMNVQNMNMNQPVYRPNLNKHNFRNSNPMPANYQQEIIDFDSPRPIDYGNYGYQAPQQQAYNQNYNPNYNNDMIANQYGQPSVYEAAPLYQIYNPSNQIVENGYNNFSNQNQFYDERYMQQQAYGSQQQAYGQGYNNQYNNYPMAPANNYNDYDNSNYSKRFARANQLPKEIAKEVRSEKLRTALMFFVGAIGIIVTSIMLAVYYKAGEGEKYLGLSVDQVMYPFFSILFLIITTGIFGLALTDYSLLYSNVKKYQRDLLYGRENVPYFITRNYRALISRGIYINWICFSTYIIGAICLGILYGFQAIYDSYIEKGEEPVITFFFWKIGTLKSFESDITVNIIVLFVTLGVHILNIVSSRNRKNNLIAYYGFEVISTDEINKIKKKANTRCLIIFFITLAIILFAIVIPWLIIRKKKGQSLKPWKAE
ncbi:MSC_0882 family membrane protein [Spiroplasma culicicola]|uniref:Transmembrane protein n=1 Tax=Spiroplasma culicicola AES-1 TaxID=1276246 RepID=W6A6W2_9MOLU|nr:hypothetical protein [Spiroplasma culicicola]AHI52706.1 hypothetical protein SCULI_v1c03650 [Spiroplasma culicicola AES-1]